MVFMYAYLVFTGIPFGHKHSAGTQPMRQTARAAGDNKVAGRAQRHKLSVEDIVHGEHDLEDLIGGGLVDDSNAGGADESNGAAARIRGVQPSGSATGFTIYILVQILEFYHNIKTKKVWRVFSVSKLIHVMRDTSGCSTTC